MSVTRQANILGQQRVDVPHIRGIESSICNDFDVLAGKIIADSTARVLTGFDLIPLSPGSAAISLQVHVAGGVMIHPLAAESGSIFSVPSTRAAETLSASNARVVGGFTASSTNYIGLDLRRRVDGSTTDLVQFLDADTLLEKPKDIPLARTLDYVLYISTQDFSAAGSLAPLAKVVTDAFNSIVSIEDARNFLCRLGSGGTVTDPKHAWPWASTRTEVGNNSDFNSGDKGLHSLKDWMDAAMTRLWELGGGEYWYSPTADRNVRMIRGGAAFTNGEWFEWDGIDLHWKGISFAFDNSAAASNSVTNQTGNSAGLTDLLDGECVYVDVSRGTDAAVLTPMKAVRSTLGTPIVPGSRYIIAWRVGTVVYTRDSSFPVGATFTVASNTNLGIVQLTYAAGTPSTPKVMAQDANGSMINTAISGSGKGFVGTGFGAGAGGDFTGGATGPALITHEVSSNTAPQITIKDSGGNVKNQVDHVGFPMGARSEFREEWFPFHATLTGASSGLLAGNIWNYDLVGANASILIIDPSTSLPCRSKKFLLAGAANTNYGCLYTEGIVCPTSSNTLVFEWWMACGNTAPSGLDYKVGLTTAADFSTTGVWVQILSGDATYRVVTNGGAATTTNTTIAPSGTGTYDRFRLEVVNATTVNLYVNGNLTSVATNLPAAGTKLRFSIRATVFNSGFIAGFMQVGPILGNWNRETSLSAV